MGPDQLKFKCIFGVRLVKGGGNYMHQNGSDGNRFHFACDSWNLAKIYLEGVSVVW